MLIRHIGLDNTEDYKLREKFLEDDLHIPPKWIHFAKVTLNVTQPLNNVIFAIVFTQ